MSIIDDIMAQWSDPYRRTVALHGINVEGGFPGAGTAAGQNWRGPGGYYQVYMGGNPYGGNSVSKIFNTPAEGIRFAAENPKFYNSAGRLVGPAFQAGGFSGFDTNAFAPRFASNPIGATDDQVHRIEASQSQRTATFPYHYTQTPSTWNNVTYPNLNTLGINPETYRPNPAGGGPQRNEPVQLSQTPQAPQAPKPGSVHDWQRGLIQDIPTQFVPPNGGDITQWAWDQNQGRYFRKGDSGKPFDQIPSYSYDYGSGQWVGNNPGVRGQMLPQGAGIGGQNAARNSLESSFSGGRTIADMRPSPQWVESQLSRPTQSPQLQPPANAQPFYKGGMAGAQQALGPGGMTLSQLGQSYQNNTFGRMPQPQQPNLGSFNVGGSGMMMVANGNGAPMMRSPINTSSLGMSAQQPMMGFGAGRPALPVAPVGNGMMSYQGGTYSPAGLALSRMQSGIR